MGSSIEAAAAATGFPVNEAESAIRQVKKMAEQHDTHVQFWCLTDDFMWPNQVSGDEDVRLMHIRLFASVRLVFEYMGPASRTITNAEERIEQLKDTILEVARTLRKHRDDLHFNLRGALGDRFRELQIRAA